MEERQQGERLLVERRRIAGEAEQQVPLQLEPGRARVAEQRQVLRAGRALGHEREQLRRQRLDPGLDLVDAGGGERHDLPQRQVRLLLVHHAHARQLRGEARHHGAKVAVGHDVVGHGHAAGRAGGEQRAELLEDARRRFLARGDPAAVEPAERAVALRAPPAAAAGLVGDRGGARGRAVGRELREVVGVVGRGEGIEIGARRALDHGRLRLAALPGRQPRLEAGLALAREHVIDRHAERADAVRHLALAVGTTEEGHRVRRPELEPAEDREAGRGLLERGGGPDDAAARVVDLRDQIIDPRRELGFEREQARQAQVERAAAAAVLACDGLDRRDQRKAAVVAQRTPAERRAREQPLAEEPAVLQVGQRGRGRLAEARREPGVGVEDLGLEAGAPGQRLQQVDAERRAIEPRERRHHEQQVAPSQPRTETRCAHRRRQATTGNRTRRCFCSA